MEVLLKRHGTEDNLNAEYAGWMMRPVFEIEFRPTAVAKECLCIKRAKTALASSRLLDWLFLTTYGIHESPPEYGGKS